MTIHGHQLILTLSTDLADEWIIQFVQRHCHVNGQFEAYVNVCLEYKGRQIMINLKMSPGDPKRSCSFLFAAKAFQNFFAGFEF